MVNRNYQKHKLFPNSKSKSFTFRAMEAATNYYWNNPNGWPPTLEILVPKYLDSIPMDGFTGSRKVVDVYDGTGGWVYNKKNGDVSSNAPKIYLAHKTYKPDDFFGKWTLKRIKNVKHSFLRSKNFQKNDDLLGFDFKEKECEYMGDNIKNPRYIIHAETTAKRNDQFEGPYLDSYEYGYHPEREEILFLQVLDKDGLHGAVEIIDNNELVYWEDSWLLFFERKQY